MSRGLRVLRSFEHAPITQIGLSKPTSVHDPLFLQLQGKGFLKAVAVRLNGMDIPGFVVVNDTNISLQLPDSLYFTVIERVDVLTESEGASGNVRVRYEVGTPQSVQGVLKLAQRIVKLLLTTPGTDIFHQSDGGGMLAILGKAVHQSGAAGVSAQVMLGLDRVSKRLIEDQAAKGLPPDERLAQLHVLELQFDQQSGTLNVRLGVESMAGSVAVTGLEA